MKTLFTNRVTQWQECVLVSGLCLRELNFGLKAVMTRERTQDGE